MLKTPDWAAGAEYLREHAPELIPLIDRFPVCELKTRKIFRKSTAATGGSGSFH